MTPLADDFEALVSFAMVHYEAFRERAETIVTNHADEVRAEMEKYAEKEKAPKEESGAAETAKPDTPA